MLTRIHVFLLNKKTCSLVEQEDMTLHLHSLAAPLPLVMQHDFALCRLLQTPHPPIHARLLVQTHKQQPVTIAEASLEGICLAGGLYPDQALLSWPG